MPPDRDRPLPHPGLVVAVDGPGGAGKSTVSRALAARLGLRWLDTGATYRALTWAALAAGVDPCDEAAVVGVADRTALDVSDDPGHPWTRVNGRDVSAAIREPRVTAAVSAVSAHPRVRRRLVAVQQRVVGAGGIVVEGRDIAAVVCPQAAVKVYLTADAAVRAARRAAEQAPPASAPAGPAPPASAPAGPAPAGPTPVTPTPADIAATADDLARRDRLDASRAADPLAPAPDAHVVDATDLDVAGVVDRILDLVAAAAAA